MKVFVSDEIADSIDVSQFYEDSEAASDGISAFFEKWHRKKLVGPVSKMKVIWNLYSRRVS